MKRLIVIIALALAGCATPGANSTPATSAGMQTAVYAANAAYEVALTAATAYAELPRCTVKSPPCSDREIVTQLVAASHVAHDALELAVVAVRTPGFGTDVQTTALTAAESAVRAFTAITKRSAQ